MKLKYKRIIKRFFKNILLLIIILILLYAIGEFITRFMLYKDGNPFRIDYQLNSEGFRDYEHNLEKSEDMFRIAVLGDSFTFGQGIYRTKDTNPKVLESLLNKKNNISYEVFNFGIRSYNTKDELKTLKENVLKYKPNLVIVNFYIDDADFEGYSSKRFFEKEITKMYPLLERENKKFPHFYYFIIKRLNGFLCKKDYSRCKDNYIGHLKEVYQSKNWDNELILFKEIKDLGKENNFKTAIVIFPILVDQANKFGLQETYYMIEEELNQDFLVLNLLEYYKNYNFKSLCISPWDAHPNEEGQEIAAKAMYDFLIEEKLVSEIS